MQDGGNIGLIAAGRPNGNAFIIFVDSKAGGANSISNTFTGGDAYQMNNLNGLTFETGSTADYAIRVHGDGWVNVANFASNTITYAGNCVSGSISNSGIITAAKAQFVDVPDSNADTMIDAADYPPVAKGAEMKLKLSSLGVPSGTQTVKFCIVLVNGGSDYGSNQVIGSLTTTADMAGMGDENFQTSAGTQTLSITVDNNDTDGDGESDISDTDDDNDLLYDIEETNTGIYVSPTNTGSDPLNDDTDDDGQNDGAEVFGGGRAFPLNFVSDPNTKTFGVMAVAGSFTTPAWKEDGSANNSMTRLGTSMANQNS